MCVLCERLRCDCGTASQRARNARATRAHRARIARPMRALCAPYVHVTHPRSLPPRQGSREAHTAVDRQRALPLDGSACLRPRYGRPPGQGARVFRAPDGQREDSRWVRVMCWVG